MMEVLSFVGRYYFVLGLLAFNLWFVTSCVSALVARRRERVLSRRRETAAALGEIVQYQTYVRYAGDLARANKAALRNSVPRRSGLRKVA